MPVPIKTLFIVVLSFISLLVPAIFAPKTSFAVVKVECKDKFSSYVQSTDFPDEIAVGKGFSVTVKFTPKADTSFQYYVNAIQYGKGIGDIRIGDISVKSTNKQTIPADSTINFSMEDSNKVHIGPFKVILMHSEGILEGEEVCSLGTVNYFDEEFNKSDCNISMPDNVQQDNPFDFYFYKTDYPNLKQKIYFYRKSDINIGLLPKGIVYLESDKDKIIRNYISASPVYDSGDLPTNPAGATGITISYNNAGGNRLNGGEYIAVAEVRKDLGKTVGGEIQVGVPPKPTIVIKDKHYVLYCSYHPFTVSTEATSPITTDGTPLVAAGSGGIIGGGVVKTQNCLDRLKNDPLKNVKCVEGGGKPIDECNTADPDNPGIVTAFGCLHTNPMSLVKDLIKLALGISGGLAFLMMVLGAYQMLTSAGNPDTLNAGRERLTSAIIGLLFVIFSILLLQIIGADILKIPGFNR